MKELNSKLFDYFISEDMFRERVSLNSLDVELGEENLDFLEDIDEEFEAGRIDHSLFEDQFFEDYAKGVFNNFFPHLHGLRDECDSYAKKKKLSPYIVLDAHGDHKNGKWDFYDDDKNYSVQRWINKQDGKYGSILIACCNADAVIPRSKESIIIFSNGSTIDNRTGSDLPLYNFEVILPGQKEPINGYSLEDDFKQLKSRK